ncbi:hypothetical protein XENOCAPTIV_023429 [Xenoophorus captivus]|uniref:Uncharacterized protein n=1 Tax=Xenoophorus captivus TaxID=1517983 RepID=A0ABV0Q5X4_9TELE
MPNLLEISIMTHPFLLWSRSQFGSLFLHMLFNSRPKEFSDKKFFNLEFSDQFCLVILYCEFLEHPHSITTLLLWWKKLFLEDILIPLSARCFCTHTHTHQLPKFN